MKVLITGASGFIGRHLVGAMKNAGFDVRAAGRRPVDVQGVEWVSLSHIENFDWKSICSDVDLVVHLAGVAHTRAVSTSDLHAINADAPVALARALRPDQFLIFVSSIRAVIGPSSKDEISEDSLPRPACGYGHAKLQAEIGIQEVHQTACILRPVTVYGAGTKYNMGRLGRIASWSLPLPVGDFRAKRSFVSVENLCCAILFAYQKRLVGTYHVADPDTASLAELVSFLREALHKPRRIFCVSRLAIMVFASFSVFRSVLQLVSQPLVARPGRLLRAGWRPHHSCTRDGVTDWAMSVARAVS